MPIAAIAGYLFQVLIGLVINVGLSLLARALSPSQEQTEPGIRTTLQIGGDNPLAFPIGRTAVAGQLEYAGTWGEVDGTPNAYLTRVISVSDLPINALTSIYVNGARSTINFGATETDQGFPVTEFNVGGADHLWVRFYDGNQTNSDAFLVSKFGSDPDRPWTSSHVGNGVAYVIVTSLINREVWTNIPAYTFEVEGVPLYDIRQDTTAGGSGPQRANDPSTWVYTDNPMVAIHSVFQGFNFGNQWIYGFQSPINLNRTPYSVWETAMDECDRLITLEDMSTEKNFRCGIEVVADREPIDLIDELLKSSAGRFADIGGQYKILSNAPAAAVISFTDEDLSTDDPKSYRPFPPFQSVHNGINAVYPEPLEAYQNKDAPPRFSPTLEAEDDNRRLVASVNYPAVPYKIQVQRLMKVAIDEERRFRTHGVKFPPRFWQIEPLDVVSWTSTENGYLNKEFLVVSMDIEETGGVVALLKEIDNADYSWTSADQLPAPVGEIIIIRPTSQPMTGWQVLPATLVDGDGDARRPSIEVRYAGLLPDVRAVRVQVRLDGTTDTIFDGEHPYDPTIATPSNILQGIFLPDTNYEVRGRFLPFSGRETEWSAWLAVTTPNVRLGADDLSDGIVDIPKLDQDIRELQAWLGEGVREIQEEVENLVATIAEQNLSSYDQVDTLTRELSLQTNNATANFNEQITVATGPNSSLAQSITTLEAEVTNLDTNVTGNSTAIQGLTTQVTNVEGNVSSNSAAITSLNSSVTDNANNISGNATAISGINTSVNLIDGQVTSNSNAITSLNSTVTSLNGTVVGNSNAITGLNTSVSNLGGQVTANSNSITTVEASVGDVSAQGIFRVQAEASPGGGYTRVGLQASATNGASFSAAAMFLDASTSQPSRFIVNAGEIFLRTGNNIFALSDDNAFIQNARIQNLTAGNIQAKSINADEILIDGTLVTDLIAANAVTAAAITSPSGNQNITQGQDDVQQINFATNGGLVLVDVSIVIAFRNPNSGAFGDVIIRLQKNGVAFSARTISVDDSFESIATWMAVDLNPGTGTNQYKVTIQATGPGPTLEHFVNQCVIRCMAGKR